MAGKTITLKYQGTCRDCGATLQPGEKARWYGRGKVYGIGCHDKTNTQGSKYRSHLFYSPSTGNEWYVNKNGRCEDAPCCGCCS